MSAKSKWLIFVGALLLLGAIVGLNLRARRAKWVEVQTEKVWRRNLTAVVEASGTIEPKVSVDITSDVIAKIIAVPVEEGDSVRRGTVLVRLDTGQQEQRVLSMEAALAAARTRVSEQRSHAEQSLADFERTESMFRQQLLSKAEYDRAKNAVDMAQAQRVTAEHLVEEAQAALAEARDQLRKYTVVAPMDGVVIRREADAGEVAVAGTLNNAGNLLMQVADLSLMEVEVQVDETEVVDLEIGQPAEVVVDAYPNRTFRGRITHVANSAILQADTADVTGEKRSADFKVEITLDEESGLRPGLNATARITTATRRQVLSIPIQALTVREVDGQQPGTSRREREKEGVFVVGAEQKAQFVPLEIGIAGEKYFEVLSGLDGGEEVVSGNYQALRELKDDDPVKRLEKPKKNETKP